MKDKFTLIILIFILLYCVHLVWPFIKFILEGAF